MGNVPVVTASGAAGDGPRRTATPPIAAAGGPYAHLVPAQPRAGAGEHQEILDAIHATQAQHVATLERLVATHEETRRLQEDEAKHKWKIGKLEKCRAI